MTKYNYLHKYFDNADAVVFFDFEATQYTHKAIALGVVIQPKKPGSLVEDTDKPICYHSLIKTKDHIGSVVSNMTGIRKEMLEKEGKSFHTVILELSKLLRPYHCKRFVSYGNGDMFIFSETMNPRDETETNFFSHLKKNYFDLAKYLSKRIVSPQGHMLSVAKLAEVYGIEIEGATHDPLYDSLLLSEIYRHYVNDKERTIELVLKNYAVNHDMMQISHQLASRLLEKNSLEKEDLIALLEEFI